MFSCKKYQNEVLKAIGSRKIDKNTIVQCTGRGALKGQPFSAPRPVHWTIVFLSFFLGMSTCPRIHTHLSSQIGVVWCHIKFVYFYAFLEDLFNIDIILLCKRICLMGSLHDQNTPYFYCLDRNSS